MKKLFLILGIFSAIAGYSQAPVQEFDFPVRSKDYIQADDSLLTELIRFIGDGKIKITNDSLYYYFPSGDSVNLMSGGGIEIAGEDKKAKQLYYDSGTGETYYGDTTLNYLWYKPAFVPTLGNYLVTPDTIAGEDTRVLIGWDPTDLTALLNSSGSLNVFGDSRFNNGNIYSTGGTILMKQSFAQADHILLRAQTDVSNGFEIKHYGGQNSNTGFAIGPQNLYTNSFLGNTDVGVIAVGSNNYNNVKGSASYSFGSGINGTFGENLYISRVYNYGTGISHSSLVDRDSTYISKAYNYGIGNAGYLPDSTSNISWYGSDLWTVNDSTLLKTWDHAEYMNFYGKPNRGITNKTFWNSEGVFYSYAGDDSTTWINFNFDEIRLNNISYSPDASAWSIDNDTASTTKHIAIGGSLDSTEMLKVAGDMNVDGSAYIDNDVYVGGDLYGPNVVNTASRVTVTEAWVFSDSLSGYIYPYNTTDSLDVIPFNKPATFYEDVTFTDTVYFTSAIQHNGLWELKGVYENLADDGTILLPEGVSGWGTIAAGDSQEYLQFRFREGGDIVELINNSANTASTDSDTNLCVYDGGSGVVIKNRLGAAKNIMYEIYYY